MTPHAVRKKHIPVFVSSELGFRALPPTRYVTLGKSRNSDSVPDFPVCELGVMELIHLCYALSDLYMRGAT